MKETPLFKFSELTTIYETDNYKLKGQIDEISGDLFVHFFFNKEDWSPSFYKELLDNWFVIGHTLKKQYGLDVIKTITFLEDTQVQKFLRLFDFWMADDNIYETENGHELIVLERKL